VNEGGKVLDGNSFRYLALANPKLAPYGKAAEQVLQHRGLWNSLHERIVRGENIGQAFQFIKSGNAELGFVPYSQIKKPDKPIEGSYWLIPPSLYDPIEQQAVLLKDNSIARSFLDFVKSNEARAIIKQFGYGVTQSAE
jgi:molybdate transport system substrate-binding protein